MKCPNTPKSVIAELLKNDDSPLWNKSWTEFFDIYYNIVRIMARKSLQKIGWTSISDDDISEITSRSFDSLEEAFSKEKYQPSTIRHFRGFLKRIVYCRAIDFIRAQNKKCVISVESIEIIDAINRNDEISENYFQKLEEDEVRAYKHAKILDIWKSIRPAYGTQSVLIFEMRILEKKPVMQICEELLVDRNKIDKAVHRILKKIKEELKKSDFGKEF